MGVQWFPGHMAKTRRLIRENLKLVDIVLELLDARIPYSSSNPELGRMIPPGKRIIVLNKSDLANPGATRLWKRHYRESGFFSVGVDSIRGRGVDQLLGEVSRVGSLAMAGWEKRGRVQKPIRTMIVGIPNVGKSSLTNRITKTGSAKTGGKPGVTRGKQWIKVGDGMELLDTPGILWPKFDDEEVGINLALTGAIKEEILDMEEMAVLLIAKLSASSADILKDSYDIRDMERDFYEILKQIGIGRGCLLTGGRVDTLRASRILIDDFRSGKLGRITLELPHSTLG